MKITDKVRFDFVAVHETQSDKWVSNYANVRREFPSITFDLCDVYHDGHFIELNQIGLIQNMSIIH